MNPKVIGIGACTIDQIFVTDQLPNFENISYASTYLKQLGGPVTNTLVALSRLGVRSMISGKVGDDKEGIYIAQELAKEKIDITQLELEKGGRSRVVLVIINESTGERAFLYRPDQLSKSSLSEETKRAIAASQVLVLDEADPVSIKAARYAQEQGIFTVYNGGWLSEKSTELLSIVDFPILSSDFVKKWLPAIPIESVIETTFSLNRKISVITKGDRGCIAMWGENKFNCSAFSVNTVDTTGAGDAFNAGFVYGIIQKWHPSKIIEFSSALAAINCLSIGGKAGLPTIDTLKKFLNENKENFYVDKIN